MVLFLEKLREILIVWQHGFGASNSFYQLFCLRQGLVRSSSMRTLNPAHPAGCTTLNITFVNGLYELITHTQGRWGTLSGIPMKYRQCTLLPGIHSVALVLLDLWSDSSSWRSWICLTPKPHEPNTFLHMYTGSVSLQAPKVFFLKPGI